ncbi:hypothetical protein A7K93_09005 [Candidatus Methylacidiphilum fumarolicum]|uniref:Uncharacterized protein n=2 Tax=Candidatus Methylacidiphilum fumarolicum TaxID=591154 RepID=I0JXI3_METFB|nr:hypothetical protein [Candidatus Methylacidiphilum fumarolicum]MBW6415273.1 hypothetical protein [Candidatus Methylacidiphilum fumarolicum]TFE69253.1 hypothetical protein A7K73_06235 [Candidatus Methylacidiphilum fumarolicum]TFE72222.1 hypothetical protein A7K72_09265 [Candidatus Methylacidiphilum fumarolicum]TFE72363.1 hypothetical protein A7K93_09005 [Candidatus Methylacidiphilum fumarolicum]TFE76979.1 hypothetical protein A7D33_07150 [Candidatus Methylacidiphilum fumarolicum]
MHRLQKEIIKGLLPVLRVIFFLAASLLQAADYDPNPPFGLEQLKPVEVKDPLTQKIIKGYQPKNPYNIFINYELGMHCVGFDISYCCVIPPYNSIQAQAVASGLNGSTPKLLTPEDKVKLYYYLKDNSYSEGNKMRYWSVLKDVNGNGSLADPGDNMANYVWEHLFIYKDLEGTLPKDWSIKKRIRIGKDIMVPIDAGPSGKPLAGGYLEYAPDTGGNIVFTDSMIPEVKNIAIKLTASNIWDALGLPLTAFNDSVRKGTIRTITDKDFQPYQYSTVQLHDDTGKPIIIEGKKVEFFGTNPVDIPNCVMCHSGEGKAAKLSRQAGFVLFEKEYEYWKKNYPDESDYMARLSASSINLLELHDKMFKTNFLKDYNPNASSNRLGSVGSVNCADCHGDNVSGNLQEPRPGTTGYKAVKARPLTESIHAVHANFLADMNDKAGRTVSCQACHPTHWTNPNLNNFDTNPYQIIDSNGNNKYANADQRTAGGGCYLRRDAHTNPAVKPPFFLNSVGKWYLENVSTRDENDQPISELRGLTCTNCHNQLSHELYKYDDLDNGVSQEGKTLRNKSIDEIIKVLADGDTRRFADMADPRIKDGNNPLYEFFHNHQGATLVKATKDSKGNLKLLAWNAKEGVPVPYEKASGGSDWWLAPAEPKCASCHAAPFVESMGGKYFPVDQPRKYSLYRFSKAHGKIACQSCHESIHGLYPVRAEGEENTVDLTTHKQALQYSPDGRYAGPVSCSACHTVNAKGVPVQLVGTEYENDYWASVVLLHFMREGDEKLPIKELIQKYPYQKSRQIVIESWK